MLLKIPDLYLPNQVRGPYEREITDIVVGGDKAIPNSFFIHAEGTYMEGIDKMLQAYQQGCRVFAASKFPADIEVDNAVTLIHTEDPVQELYRLAALIRAQSHAQIIAITGSCGKTTTKDMIAHILRGRYKKTLKTYRNYNGALGVALTLRKLERNDSFAVVEIGLGEAGSVARGAALAKPHAGVITNIGVSHIARFGSIENIAQEKVALLDYVILGGAVFLNGDDLHLRRLAKKSNIKAHWFGLKKRNDLRALDIRQISADTLFFTVTYQGQHQDFTLQAAGAFQIYNALAAISVGLTYGLTLSEMAARLATFVLGEQRLKPIKIRDFTLLDDGYNSNPRAMAASLDALKNLPLEQGNRIAVIGDMQDLGRYTQVYYKQLAHKLKTLELDYLIFVGSEASKLANELKADVATNAAHAAQLVSARIKPGGVVLLKGQDDQLFKNIRREIERENAQ